MTTQLSVPRLRTWYGALNVAMLLATAIALAIVSGEQRALYVVLLTAICTSPLLWMDRLNSRYTLLCAFFAAYFLYFGVADLFGLFQPAASVHTVPLLTPAEIAVLTGGFLVLLGYHATARQTRATSQSPANTADWSTSNLVLIGLILWVLGTLAVWYWSVHVVVRRSVEIDNQLSSLGTTIVMLGRLVQPLGIMMLAYALVVTRSRRLLPLILAICVLQVVLGFISDSKETALRGAALVILVKFLVEGRVPKAWLAGGVLFVSFAFPIFQAYRYEVTGERGVTNEQAAKNLGELLQIAYAAKDKVAAGFYGAGTRGQTFFERASLKNNVELIVARTGHGVEYQRGHTLQPLLGSFMPRLFWPDKPDVAAGQLMNQEFDIAWEQDVYISPSHLGELYWNFGWPGVAVGMLALGVLLGFINSRWDLSQSSSLTRLLVIAVTLYALCLRFEGTIATGYTVWLRSLAAIWLLHVLFARGSSHAEVVVEA